MALRYISFLLLLTALTGCAAPTAAVPTPTLAPAPTAAPTATPAPTLAPTATPAPTIAPTATPAPTDVPTVAPTSAPAPAAADETVNGALGQQLDAAVQAHEGGFSGVVLVARGDDILLLRGYNRADRARGLANTPKTRFRIGSISKQFTAMAVLILQNDGKLAIDDRLCAHLAPCPAAWQPVTIRQTLGHTAGIPNYTDDESFAANDGKPVTPGALLARFRDRPLDFPPGSQYQYSNGGYAVLGALIEQVAEMPYGEFLNTRIFAPLEMRSAAYAPELADTDARGYSKLDGPPTTQDLTNFFASGGLVMNAPDMLRWSAALPTEQLIPDDLRAEMFVPSAGDYGLGFRIAREDDRRVIWHAGIVSGFSNYFARYPVERLTIIVLSNDQNLFARGLGNELMRVVFAAPAP